MPKGISPDGRGARRTAPIAGLALALFILYLALAVGARTLLQKLWTGSSGFRGIGGRPGSTGWFGRVLFAGVCGALGLADGGEEGGQRR